MEQRRLWAVIPVKAFSRAKQRLAGVLTPAERQALSRAMLEDMLQCLGSVAGIAGILLVSDEPAISAIAARYGAHVIADPPGRPGLNPAVRRAVACLSAQKASHLLLLHGDLPCIRGDEVDRLVGGLCAPGAVQLRLSPDRHGSGTNGLVCTLPPPLTFCYGEGSLNRHLASAVGSGCRPRIVRLPGFELDIDRPADLLRLQARIDSSGQVGGKTRAFIGQPVLSRRLRPMHLAGRAPASPLVASSISGNDHAH